VDVTVPEQEIWELLAQMAALLAAPVLAVRGELFLDRAAARVVLTAAHPGTTAKASPSHVAKAFRVTVNVFPNNVRA
jgi:hypothetical protein